MTTEQSRLRTILENHILKLKITLSELYNGQLLETLAGKLLRVFIYRTVRTLCVFVCVLLHQRVKQRQEGMGKKDKCRLPSWKSESHYWAPYQVLT